MSGRLTKEELYEYINTHNVQIASRGTGCYRCPLAQECNSQESSCEEVLRKFYNTYREEKEGVMTKDQLYDEIGKKGAAYMEDRLSCAICPLFQDPICVDDWERACEETLIAFYNTYKREEKKMTDTELRGYIAAEGLSAASKNINCKECPIHCSTLDKSCYDTMKDFVEATKQNPPQVRFNTIPLERMNIGCCFVTTEDFRIPYMVIEKKETSCRVVRLTTGKTMEMDCRLEAVPVNLKMTVDSI